MPGTKNVPICNGTIHETVGFVPMDSEAQRWWDQEPHRQWIAETEIALADSLRNNLVKWRELEDLTSSDGKYRRVPNPRTAYGIPDAGYGVISQEVQTNGEVFNLARALTPRPAAQAYGDLVGRVVAVKHGTSRDAAKMYFDHIDNTFRNAKIQTAGDVTLLATSAAPLAGWRYAATATRSATASARNLSEVALDARVRHAAMFGNKQFGVAKRNVAVVEYFDPRTQSLRTITKFSRDGIHAERRAIEIC